VANANAARIRLDADGADIRRAFDGVVRDAVRANNTLVQATRRAVAQQKTSLRELAREYATLALNVRRLAQANESVTAASQKRITNVARSEQRARDRDADNAAVRDARRTAQIEEIKARSEANITRIKAQEQRRRMQDEQRASNGGGGSRDGRGPYGNGRYRTRRADVSFNAIGAVREYARDMHGQVQGAREARANTETSLNDAFVQAVSSGVDIGEARSLRDYVLRFARQHGMREEDIAPAINEAQTRFSVISDAGEGETGDARRRARYTAVGNLLEATRLGRLTGNSPVETARFFGAMQQRGMSSGVALAATRQAIAAGFSGAVSMGEVSQQALSSLSQTVASSQAGVSDPAERERIARSEVARFFANLQIQAAVGARAGTSGNRLAGLERFFDSDARVGLMHARLTEHFTNTRDRGGLATMNSLFQQDQRTGRWSLRDEAKDPTQFASTIAAAFGGDVNAFANVMGARGNWSKNAGGRNQVMNAPLVQALSNVMAVGPDVLQRRNAIMNSELDPQQLRTIEGIRAQEDTTTLVRAQQENRDALRDNSNAIVVLSDKFATWQSSNPFTASAFTALGGAFGGGFLARIGVFQWGMGGMGGGAAGGAPGAVSGVLSGSGAAAGAARGAFGLSGMGLAGGIGLAAVMTGAALYQVNDEHNARTGTTLTQRLTDEEGAYAASMRHQRSLDTMRQTGNFGMSPRSIAARDRNVASILGADNGGALTLNLSEQSINQLAQAWRDQGVNVNIDPHAAAHINSTNNGQDTR